ncbi:MAG: ABC transporter permease [Acholeplasmatales bacterium]|nr:ABC transporter permease [Acholeplasmatales bacterium]
MRFKDYIYTSRKMYGTKNIIFIIIGFIFSLSIIFSIIFISYQFRYGIVDTINNDYPEYDSMYIKDNHRKSLNYDYDEYKNKYGIDELVSTLFVWPNRSRNKEIYLDGEEISYDFEDVTQEDDFYSYWIFDDNVSDDFYTKYDEKYLKRYGKGDAILAGESFKDDKDEIMVSDAFCNLLGINYDDIIGKKVSYLIYFNKQNNQEIYVKDDVTGEYKIYNNSDPIEYYEFKDYKIIGVYNDFMVNRTPSRRESGATNTYFMVKRSSVVDLDTARMRKYEDGYEYYDNDNYYFDEEPSAAFEKIYNNQGICHIGSPGEKIGRNSEESSDDKNVLFLNYCYFNDFDSGYSFYKMIKDSNNSRSFDYYENTRLDQIYSFMPFYELISKILLISTIVLVLIAMINTLRIMQKYIKNSMGFLSMSLAIGMKKKSIYILTYIEMIKSAFYSLIPAVLISLSPCILFNNYMTQRLRMHEKAVENSYMFNFNVSFSSYPWIILISFFSFVLIVFILSSIILKISDRKMLINRLNGE